jgi:hypothetical protein
LASHIKGTIYKPLKVSENRVLKRIFGPETEEIGDLEKWLNEDFIICTLHKILLERSNRGGLDGRGM